MLGNTNANDIILPNLTNPATAEQILEGYEVVDNNGNKLIGISNAKVLPILSKPAKAYRILKGYQAIDGGGKMLTGTLSPADGCDITIVDGVGITQEIQLSGRPLFMLFYKKSSPCSVAYCETLSGTCGGGYSYDMAAYLTYSYDEDSKIVTLNYLTQQADDTMDDGIVIVVGEVEQ